jgi:hypothetical protein
MVRDYSPVLALYVSKAERDEIGAEWEEIARPFEDCANQFDNTVSALPADGWFFAVFANALDALRCALVIQRRSVAGAVETAAHPSPLCHVGLNIEMIPMDAVRWPPDTDDSVCRLVALSEPGGICLSRTIFDEVRFQVDLPFDTERDPRHTAYQCQEIRRKLDTLNLLEAGSVRIGAADLAGYLSGTPNTDDATANAPRIFENIRGMLGRRSWPNE